MVSSRKFRYLTFVLIVVCGLVGCSNQEADSELTIYHVTDFRAAESADEPVLQLEYDDVTVVSSGGMEVGLEVVGFQTAWDRTMSHAVETQINSTVPTYTLVLWDRQNHHPSVVQLYAEGMKMDSHMITSKNYDEFLEWIGEQIGREFFSSIEMERMSLSALDLGIRTQIPDTLAEEIFTLIRSSNVITNDNHVFAPLFPYYQLEIEYSGKEFLRLDIMSPTVLQLQDGNDTWHYELDDFVFKNLKEIIPTRVYTQGHIKSLFQAENVVIHDPEKIRDVHEHFEDTLQAQSWIHALIRILAEGTRTDAEHGAPNEQPPLILEFELTGNQHSRVLVYDHLFIHNQTRYQRSGIREEITRLIEDMTK